MKNIIILILALQGFSVAYAQTKPLKKTVTHASPRLVLKSLNDSASYAIGISIAKFYQQQGVSGLNTACITQAINAAFAKKPVLLNDAQSNTVIMNYLNKLEQAKSQPAITAGEKLLAENKKRSDVKTTASGLQYEILRAGTGPKPGPADSVICHYKGTLPNGTEFDNSYSRGQPVTFAIGGVIKGWTEALLLMPVGSKWKLYIPYQLGYGAGDYGPIPGGSMLTFEVELLGIANK